jgi:hypothetical protein
MTAHSLRDESYSPPVTRSAETPERADSVRPRWASRLWAALRSAAYGFDAAALITHGAEVPADHPARNRPGTGSLDSRTWSSPGD